jgi:hypothetical protein
MPSSIPLYFEPVDCLAIEQLFELKKMNIGLALYMPVHLSAEEV